MSKTDKCPYCGSDDLVTRGQVTTCVECEANAVMGMWSSPRAIRAYRNAVANSHKRFEES